MAAKSKTKMFQRALARYCLLFFSWLLKWLPLWAVRCVNRVMVNIAYFFVIRQKQIARESLHIAFQYEKNSEQIERIIRRSFHNFGYAMMEMLYYLAHPSLVEKNVTIVGEEHIKQTLDEGKGMIAVTAHFGNFPLMMLYCALKGYDSSCLIRPSRDEKIEKILYKRRKQVGLKTIYSIPRKQCVNNSLRVLRNNEILFVPLDQNTGSAGSVFVDFFGQKAGTATGPIIFAKRTGAPIVPMFIMRQDDGSHKIIVEKPFKLQEKESDEETLLFNTQRITNLIEGYIRRYPHEWGWMHRRWKSRPSSMHKRALKAV